MQEIQKTMIEIYHKNINFLKNNHINLYKRIQELEKNLIETAHIDFVDNHFELVINDNKTYNCDPFYDAQYRSKHIFNNENVFYQIDPKKKVASYGDIIEDIDASNFINEYINELQNIQIDKDDIKKFIFIGTLLGVHINDIHNVIKSEVYLVVEPSLEIFRLSLFLTDYEVISKSSKLFFAIEEDINSKVVDFLNFKPMFNNYIRFELASKNEIDTLSKVSELLTLENKIRYPFSEYIYSLKRGMYFLNNSNNGILKLENKTDFLKDKPILFLATGPSFEKYIDFIKEAKDRFLIVAAAATLKLLEKNSITPDIIISIDAGKSTVRNQFDVQKEFYKDSIILSSIKTDPEVYNEIDNTHIYFIQTTLELLHKHGIITGVTVGDVGLKILLQLGAKQIYLLGLDAAIDEETGYTHSSSYEYKSQIKNNTSNDYENFLVDVKGNFKKNVKTTLLYKDMIDSINEIDSNLIGDTLIYNLSNGAYFENTKSLKLLNLNIQNFKRFEKVEQRSEYKNFFKTITTKNLPSKDLSEIKKELKIIKKLENSKDKLKEFDKQKRSFPNSFIIQILNEFILLVAPYNYYMNEDMIFTKQFDLLIKKFNEIYQEAL